MDTLSTSTVLPESLETPVDKILDTPEKFRQFPKTFTDRIFDPLRLSQSDKELKARIQSTVEYVLELYASESEEVLVKKIIEHLEEYGFYGDEIRLIVHEILYESLDLKIDGDLADVEDTESLVRPLSYELTVSGIDPSSLIYTVRRALSARTGYNLEDWSDVLQRRLHRLSPAYTKDFVHRVVRKILGTALAENAILSSPPTTDGLYYADEFFEDGYPDDGSEKELPF